MKGAALGCLPVIFGWVIVAVLGYFLVEYDVGVLFGAHIPGWAAVVVALVAGYLVAPVAFICWVAQLVGFHAPFFHLH